MLTSRIRGGTPFEHWGEQHSINDPELTARLERLGRLTHLRNAEHIQESIDAANAVFQPIPDFDPDCEESSPVGGLPSPAKSPPPSNLQLHGAQAVRQAMSHPQSAQPVDSDMEEADVEVYRRSNLLDAHSSTPATHQPQHPRLQTSRTESPTRLPSPRSGITTRSRASYKHTFWELDDSGKRGRRIIHRPFYTKTPAQVAATPLKLRQQSTKTLSFAGIKKQQLKRRRL